MRGGPPTARAIVKARAGDGVSLNIAQAGGLAACKSVAEIALAAGFSLYGGTMLEGPIATAASAHLFSVLPKAHWHTELFGPLLLSQEILATPLSYEEFSLLVPAGPGLGIELNEDAVFEAVSRENSAEN